MKIEVPFGEVVDKISILTLKSHYITAASQRNHVATELATLRAAWSQAGFSAVETLPEWRDLHQVNHQLWRVEDALREHEHKQSFNQEFVALARSVYQLNDRRAALKRSISVRLGSRLLEEKGYTGPHVSFTHAP